MRFAICGGKGRAPYIRGGMARRQATSRRGNAFISPPYAEAVLRTPQFEELCRRAESEHLALFDFDGYREDQFGMSLLDVIECETKTMGHAFVLKLLVEHGGRYDIDQMAAEGLLTRTGNRPERPSAQLRLL